MANLVLKYPAVHSQRLERWLGTESVEHISRSMRGWYANPIGVAMTPGKVYAGPDGDFCGKLIVGRFANLFESVIDKVSKISKLNKLYTGFASLGDMVAEATAGKLQQFVFNKVGPTGVANVTSTLWRVGPQPAAGGAASAAPGGRACTSSTVGAFPYTNPGGSDTLHFVSGNPITSVAGNVLLLYDRIFDVLKTINSTATEAVTGVPTRYQNTTGAQADSISGNFLFVEVGGTALAATAHNWTVCTYTDQGNAASTLPSLTGNASAIVDRLDHPVNQWFAPLETGDSGIKALTQMQCSALVATGAINFVIGHPLAWMPCQLANISCPTDAIRSVFQLTRIFDNACLSFLEVNKPSVTATTYTGTFAALAG